MCLSWVIASKTLAILTQLIGENEHTEWIDSFAEYEKTEYEQVIRKEIHPCEGALNMGEVVRAVSEASHHEAILVTDVGQNQMMAARYFKYSKNRSIVTSGGLNHGLWSSCCNRGHFRSS